MPLTNTVITYTNRTNLLAQISTLLRALGWTQNSAGPPLVMTSPVDPQGRSMAIRLSLFTLVSNSQLEIQLDVAGDSTIAAPVLTRYINLLASTSDTGGNVNFLANESWFLIWTTPAIWLMGGWFQAFASASDDPKPMFVGGSRNATDTSNTTRNLTTNTNTGYYHVATDGTTQLLCALTMTPGNTSNQFSTKRGATAGQLFLPVVLCGLGSASLSEARGILPRALYFGSNATPANTDTETVPPSVYISFGETLNYGGIFYQNA